MSDDFFDDEQELMEAEAPVSSAAPARADKPTAGASSAQGPEAAFASDRQAPPFWMVLAIAAIALILGIVIGYLLGTNATLAELSQASGQAANASASTSTDSATALPEGHPQLDIADDGTATLADSGSASE